jgi:hypothetical protein
MTSVPTTNLVDLPWIAVRQSDDTAATVSLRDALVGAHTLKEITASSPLEHEAITRFLTTVTALVVRAAGPDWDPRTDPQFPVHAVEEALSLVIAHCDLAGVTDPFMQDVASGSPSDFGAAPVASLSLDRPNGTVQAWHFRDQLGERPDGQVTWARLGVLLVTFWYFSAASNSDIEDRKQVGGLCGKAGNGLHMFWRGPTLAHTLLANTPTAWVESTDLPAWADRDGSVSGASYAGASTAVTPLWWGAYSPNTVIVWADGVTGDPAFSITGGCPRQPKGTPAPLTRRVKDDQAKTLFTQRFPDCVGPDGRELNQKAEQKAIAKGLGADDADTKLLITALTDGLRVADCAGTLGAAKPELLSSMSPDLATLRNLSVWYQAGAAEMLKQRASEVVLRPSRRGGQWVLEFCHTTTKNPTVPVYTSAAWVGREAKQSAQFTLEPDEAKAVLSVAKRVETIAVILVRQLAKRSILADLVGSRLELKDHFYYLADGACTQAISDAVSGKEMAQNVIDAVRAAALDAFDDVIAPFAGPAMSITIIQARARLRIDLAKEAATHSPGRQNTKSTTEGNS